jgi:dephospho-CoA kinase
VLGIVGGLASGKSTVAKLLADRGARVVDADRIGHQALELTPVKEALRKAFGDAIFDGAGHVSHQRLAEAAFGRPELVQKLNSIVHPPILAEIRAQVARLKKEQGVPLVVLDAALLMEANLDKELCQALLFIDAPWSARQERATTRSRMSAGQFGKREQAQLQEEVKRRAAGYVVSNSGSLRELKRQVEKLWPELCRMRARRSALK